MVKSLAPAVGLSASDLNSLFLSFLISIVEVINTQPQCTDWLKEKNT